MSYEAFITINSRISKCKENVNSHMHLCHTCKGLVLERERDRKLVLVSCGDVFHAACAGGIEIGEECPKCGIRVVSMTVCTITDLHHTDKIDYAPRDPTKKIVIRCDNKREIK